MISKETVLEAARLSGVDIPDKRVAAVQANLDRLAQVATLLQAVELGPEDEIAPVWRP